MLCRLVYEENYVQILNSLNVIKFVFLWNTCGSTKLDSHMPYGPANVAFPSTHSLLQSFL